MEVLVVDNGSRDGSGQMDSEFSNVTVQRLPRNFGKTCARNIGCRTGRAALILFLDPDVEVAPGTVMDLVKTLESDDQAVAVVPRLVDNSGVPAPLGSRLPNRVALAAACRSNSSLPLGPAETAVEFGSDAALLVRKSFLRGLNYLDEKRYSEFGSELELFWRIHSAGKRVAISSEKAILHERRINVRIPRTEEALIASDRVTGAAAFISRSEGWAAMVSFLAGQFFHALKMGLREPGYGLRLALGILAGNRIDGTQGGELG